MALQIGNGIILGPGITAGEATYTISYLAVAGGGGGGGGAGTGPTSGYLGVQAGPVW